MPGAFSTTGDTTTDIAETGSFYFGSTTFGILKMTIPQINNQIANGQ